MSESQQAPIHNPEYVSFKNLIEGAAGLMVLDAILPVFQSACKEGKLSQTEIVLLVHAGKKKRAELSAAEGKKSPARQALEKATYQGPAGVPRPNPHQMQDDELTLYRTIIALDPELPDAFAQLEKLELWYMEKERSDYGKKWLVPAVDKKLAEITTAWAKKAERAE